MAPLRPIGFRKNTGDIATGWALIGYEPRLVSDRANSHHLVHRNFATRARNGASPLRQIGHDAVLQFFTTDKRAVISSVASLRTLYGRKVSVKETSARGRGRPTRVSETGFMPIRARKCDNLPRERLAKWVRAVMPERRKRHLEGKAHETDGFVVELVAIQECPDRHETRL